jgi:hypothetical protein
MNPRTIIIDGRTYVWRDLVRMRREQLQAIANRPPADPVRAEGGLRPETHRTAAGRYLAPSLFALLF